MRAFVFTDKALGRQAGRFVWLSINTEKKENAPVLGKYPVRVWPSFYVIDPATEKIVLRWVGGATVPQMVRVLDDGEKAARGKAAEAARAALADADRLYADGALPRGRRRVPQGARDPEAGRLVLPAGRRVAPLRALDDRRARDLRGDGARRVPALQGDAVRRERRGLRPRLRALAERRRCREGGPRRGPRRGRTRGRRRTEDGTRGGRRVRPCSSSLADEREAAKDDAGRKKILESWAAYLEGQAAKAKTPAERAVFDAHLTGVCLALGQPERVVPALLAVREGLPGRLQPAAAPRARVRGDEEVRRGARGVRPRDGARRTARASSSSTGRASTS